MKNLKSVGITQIEEIDAEDVFDITVPDNHNFFTNGKVLSHNCYVILDEAQNTTQKQMKLFLTRLGFNTFFCVNGDITQCDLEPKSIIGGNGLEHSVKKLVGKEGEISVCQFSERDIVRNPLIAKILKHLDSPDDFSAPFEIKSSSRRRQVLMED
jgi:phosphate starvation-inducible PhoH-like protein